MHIIKHGMESTVGVEPSNGVVFLEWIFGMDFWSGDLE